MSPVTAQTRPQVVAHRGASQENPEHTLAAYLRAMERGAEALECDVRMTADGHLVCVHDRTVDRTSNGSGLVSTLELTDLEGLDWGSWKKLAKGLPKKESFFTVLRDGMDIDELKSPALYFGTTTGQLWIGRDGGEEFECLFDSLPPINCVKVGVV